MDPNIPVWAQQLTAFGVMIGSVILGVWKYFKTQAEKVVAKEKIVETSVIGNPLDSKLLREAIDTMRESVDERGRQSQRETRAFTDLRESIIELIEAVHVNTNASLNMLRFLKRPTDQ